MSEGARLTLKQRRFVAEYLIDGNAKQAAIRAGYSEDSAHSIGHENLSKPEISDRLRELEDEHLRALDLTAEKIALAHWQDHLTAVANNRTGESTAALNGVLKARSLGGTNVKIDGEIKMPSEEAVRDFRAAREKRDADA